MIQTRSLGCGLLFLAMGAGCGARSEPLDDGAPKAGGFANPAALYARGDLCPKEESTSRAATVMARSDAGRSIAVVEIFFQDECTGAGGQHIIAREVGGFRAFWLGAHTCRFYSVPVPAGYRYGVVRYNITAALFQIPPDVCIGFPGSLPGVQTEASTQAIAVFETLADARAFASGLPR